MIGATNRPDVLDPALLRPGRFDRAVGLELPDEHDRLEILQVHARSKALADDVDLEAIAERAVGMTGADLASVMNEAALQAAALRKRAIVQRDLEEALTRIREAPERQRRLLDAGPPDRTGAARARARHLRRRRRTGRGDRGGRRGA